MRAIGFLALATLCFAALDATGKYLIVNHGVPVIEVHGSASLVMSCSAPSRYGRWRFTPSLRSAKPMIQILRSGLMVVTTGFNFLASAISSSTKPSPSSFSPLLVAGLAGPLLGEWVGWHRMLAIIAGFFGVLLVMHPGIGSVHWAMLIALVATLVRSTIATRYLAAFDPATVTQTYTPLAGVIVLAAPRLRRQWPADGFQTLLLASLGFWGGLGHWFLILAHREAPARARALHLSRTDLDVGARPSRVRRRADAVDSRAPRS